MLFPLLFPEFVKNHAPERDYIIIPHYSDEYLFQNDPHLVSVKNSWAHVVTEILNSKFVIASALSGVILAEAFGIPARLLMIENLNNTENLTKYQDYYFGTNRLEFHYAKTVKEALEMGGEPMPRCDLEQLYEAFPFDLFNLNP